jgi:hypothetical protein
MLQAMSRLRIVAALLLTAGLALAQEEEPRISRREGGPRIQVFGNVMARELGLRLVEVQEVRHRARHQGRELEATGPCVVLDGVEVVRLRFERAIDALDFLVYVVRPGRTPLVADARGRQLVLLSGRRLLEPARTARVLGAAWADEVLDAPERGIEALRVLSPPVQEGVAQEIAFDAALFLGRGDTPAWAQHLEKLRVARAYAERPTADGPAVRFLSTNHFTFESAAGGYSEVAMNRQATVATVGQSSERCRVLVGYGRDLLEALAEGSEAGDTPRARMLGLAQEVLQPPDAPAPPEGGEDLGGQ